MKPNPRNPSEIIQDMITLNYCLKSGHSRNDDHQSHLLQKVSNELDDLFMSTHTSEKELNDIRHQCIEQYPI